MVDIYCVVWHDAQGGANIGWRDIEELKTLKPAIAVSVGAVLHQDEYKLIICPHVLLEEGEVTEGDAELVIPTSWVTSLTKIYTLE